MQTNELVTVFGGTGFIGRYIVRRLLKAGYRVRVAVRRPDLAQFLQPMGTVGQVQAIQANLRYPETIQHALKGASHVINAVGILTPTGEQKFESVVAEGAKYIAEAAKAEGIDRIIHISAIGANEDDDGSAYQHAKYCGEQHVLGTLPLSTILRPSIVFGAEDEFFNRFASLSKMSFAIPLFSAETKFQPIYVDDVAEAAVKAMGNAAFAGQIYELGGAETASFKSLIENMLEIIQKKRVIIPVPDGIAPIMTPFLSIMPSIFKFTKDQFITLQRDNIVSEQAIDENRTLSAFGITPVSMEQILPQYLVRYRKDGQFAPTHPSEI